MLAISYRFSVVKEGQPCTIEQQLYCTLRDGLIDQLNLLCSGFQPVQMMGETPIGLAANYTPVDQRSIPQPALQADAFLKFETRGGQASTCAILTPSIKHKLGEMSSGQVQEVWVDDPAAREDIEAWCRLTGNSLLKMDQGAGQELPFFLKKK
jgi:TusA-related sulfurtransferase